MKKTWLIFFAVALITDLIGVYVKNDLLVYVAKPLVVPALIIYFIDAIARIKSRFKKLIIGALLFSWLGDVLLIFESADKNFFLFGLVAFLIAHLFYILFFNRIQTREKIKLKWIFLALVLAYYSVLMYQLNSYLGEMRWPVRIYGLVISTMLLLALHALFIKNKIAGKMMLIGALLFVASDSVLAINKFYQPFEFAGIITMLTYGLAQLLITVGAVQYITSISKQ